MNKSNSYELGYSLGNLLSQVSDVIYKDKGSDIRKIEHEFEDINKVNEMFLKINDRLLSTNIMNDYLAKYVQDVFYELKKCNKYYSKKDALSGFLTTYNI